MRLKAGEAGQRAPWAHPTSGLTGTHEHRIMHPQVFRKVQIAHAKLEPGMSGRDWRHLHSPPISTLRQAVRTMDLPVIGVNHATQPGFHQVLCCAEPGR